MFQYEVPSLNKTIVLYRGDNEKIKEFNISKTHKYCLVGQGIYLTNKESVAESYRIKGKRYFNNNVQDITLFNGWVKNKEEAVKTAWPMFLNEMHHREYGVTFNPKSKNSALFVSRMQDAWYNMEHSGAVDIRRINTESRSSLEWHFEIILKVSGDLKEGYITTFEFPKDMFNRNVYNVEGHHGDSGLIDILLPHMPAEAVVKYQAIANNRYSWYEQPRGMSFLLNMIREGVLSNKTSGRSKRRFTYNERVWQTLRNILEPYGVIGLEYSGGIYTGGCGNHRAFCIWDDDFVNQHKVSRHR